MLVSGSGLSASACSHACGRFRGIALGPGAGFPFVSSWWKGRLMGQRLVIVSSPLDGCVYSLRLFVEICRFGAFSPGVVGFSSSSVGQFTVGRGGTFPRGNCSEFP